jgi:glutathione S-transferase
MITIWGRRSSFNVQKVLWLADELGLTYEHIPAGGDHRRLDEPAFRRMNPNGLVPVLQDGDLSIWESHAILRYLAARHGSAHFWAADPAARSYVDRWMDWSQTALQPAFLGGIFWGYYRTPEAQRNGPQIQKDLNRCKLLFLQLDNALAGREYLLGHRLSLADMPAATSLYRYFELDIERPALPNVEAWYERLKIRPAYQRNVMLPFGELKGKLDF